MKVEHKQFGNNPLQFSPFCFQLKILGEIPGSYHAFLRVNFYQRPFNHRLIIEGP